MTLPIMPVYIEFHNWANQTKYDRSDLSFPDCFQDTDWKEWAAQVINMNNLITIPIPSENDTDWREWAIFFISLVY